VNSFANSIEEHVDMATLDMLKEVMEDGFVNLLETYINDSKVRLDDLQNALAAGDGEAVRRAAHSLKGSSGNLGANRMAALCLDVENRGKDDQLDGLDKLLVEIKQEYQQVTSIMQSFL